MPDRIIREDLLESDRWLDLHSDSARLVFVQMLLTADDFGNLEGGRRLHRKIQQVTQIKSDADATKVLSELADADLTRRYEVDGREYWHLPRFKSHRTYTSRKCPQSPWCDPSVLTSLEIKNSKLRKQSDADMPQTSDKSETDLRRGVGVGVGVGVGKNKFMAPNVGQVRAYAQKHGYQVNPEKFVAHYESNGWKVGKNPMKSWEATVRTWHQTNLERKGSDPSSSTPTYLTD